MYDFRAFPALYIVHQCAYKYLAVTKIHVLVKYVYTVQYISLVTIDEKRPQIKSEPKIKMYFDRCKAVLFWYLDKCIQKSTKELAKLRSSPSFITKKKRSWLYSRWRMMMNDRNLKFVMCRKFRYSVHFLFTLSWLDYIVIQPDQCLVCIFYTLMRIVLCLFSGYSILSSILRYSIQLDMHSKRET